MSAQYSLEKDLKELDKLTDSLEDYVRGKELYGNAGSAFFSQLPALTLGAVLMRHYRLNALRHKLNDTQRTTLHQAGLRIDSVTGTWRVHTEEKLLWEANSRLDAMRPFFQECQSSPRQCVANYPTEASRRTIIQHVLDALERMGIESSDVIRKRKESDGLLRSMVVPCAFIWAEVLGTVYSPTEYWWLYHQPEAPSR